MKRNNKIRNYARDKGVCLWQIADRLGIADFAFSKRLRRELPLEEQTRIMHIIDELSREVE